MKLKDTVHFNWYKHLFLVLLLAVCVGASIHVTDADFGEIYSNMDQMTSFMKRFLTPDFSYLPKIIEPMLLTIKMSVVGTVLGVLFAVPFAFLATVVVTKNQIVTTIVRFFLDVIDLFSCHENEKSIPNVQLVYYLGNDTATCAK